MTNSGLLDAKPFSEVKSAVSKSIKPTEKKRKYHRTIPHSKRHFRCPFNGCSRNYWYIENPICKFFSSEPSLILHIKLKHAGAELTGNVKQNLLKNSISNNQS